MGLDAVKLDACVVSYIDVNVALGTLMDRPFVMITAGNTAASNNLALRA